jgi:iron complex outermembrane receptor protein
MKKTVIFLVLLTPWISNAQTIDSLTVKSLNPVSINAASALRVTYKDPFAASTLSEKVIQKNNNAQDLPYLLQFLPSVVVGSDAGTGVGYTNMRVRGTDGTRINVTLNGVPVNDAESQATYFVDFADVANSTNSIQLQRGVGTSTNGPGAFGATLSMQTIDADDSAKLILQSVLGSFNTTKWSAKMQSKRLDNGLQFGLRLSKVNSDGYINRSASDLKSMQFNMSWLQNPKTKWTVLAMLGKEKTGQAWDGVPQDSLKTNRTYNGLGLKEDGTYYANQTDNYQQNYYQAFYDKTLHNNASLHAGVFLTTGEGYYEEYKLDQDYASYHLSDFITTNNDTITATNLVRQLWLDNKNYGALFSYNQVVNKCTITLGGLISQYEGKHFGIVTWAKQGVPNDYKWYQLSSLKKDANVYAKTRYQFSENFIGFAELQLRSVAYDMNGFRKNIDLHPTANYLFLNPKIGLTYFVEKNNSLIKKAYASLAIANKEPNRDDFETNILALPKAEQLTDLELGYEYVHTKLQWSANAYLMSYHNQLVNNGKINDVGAYTRVNVDQSYRAGLELQGAYVINKKFNLFANLTLSKNKIKAINEFIDDYDSSTQRIVAHANTDIILSPNVVAAAGLHALVYQNKTKTIDVDVLGKHVGQQYLDNTSNASRSIAAYTVTDLKSSFTWVNKNAASIRLQASVTNIFNRAYEASGYNFNYYYDGQLSTNNVYYPQAKRMLLLSILWQIK